MVPDPFNSQAYDRYAYCYNNPISNTDPTGHAPVVAAVLTATLVTAAETCPAWLAAVAWAGAFCTTVGYFTQDPVMMSLGGVMLGIAGGYGAFGGVGAWIGGGVGAATSPISPLDPGIKEAIGWAWTAACWIKMGYDIANAENPEYGIGESDDSSSILEKNKPNSVSEPSNPSTATSGDSVWPAKGPVTSKYGWRTDPFTGKKVFHPALDIGNKVGDPVVASDSGVVASIKPSPNGANQVIIHNSDGAVSGYAHVKPSVSVGMQVNKGATIGVTDLSGRSTGGHVHYTFRPGPGLKRVDPLTHLPKKNNYPF